MAKSNEKIFLKWTKKLRGKYGQSNEYKEQIQDLAKDDIITNSEINLEQSIAEKLDAKLIELQKDLNIIKIRN